MVLLHSLDALREWQAAASWGTAQGGFVPTMGAMHDGHSSLIREACGLSDLVVVSVLVNPTQFNDARDFALYPRDLEADAAKAKAAGAHALFAPSAEELYGGLPEAKPVNWGALTHTFEGAHRPGHFDGVIAVVDLLFEAVRPKVAVFGEKDLQQVAVVRRLAQERHPELRVVVGKLIREANGLALSSRNARLNHEGRRHALALSRTLNSLQEAVRLGQDWEQALHHQRQLLARSPGVALEYLDAVNPETFEPVIPNQSMKPYAVVAASVQGVRLIDNAPLRT